MHSRQSEGRSRPDLVPVLLLLLLLLLLERVVGRVRVVRVVFKRASAAAVRRRLLGASAI